MPIHTTRTSAYANLDKAWLRNQTARLHQRHLQFLRHFRLDIDTLLARAANLTRAARPAEDSIAGFGVRRSLTNRKLHFRNLGWSER